MLIVKYANISHDIHIPSMNFLKFQPIHFITKYKINDCETSRAITILSLWLYLKHIFVKNPFSNLFISMFIALQLFPV